MYLVCVRGETREGKRRAYIFAEHLEIRIYKAGIRG